MAATLEKQAKRWTYEECHKLEDDRRYETIDGHLHLVVNPDTWRQGWLGELGVFLKLYVTKKNLGRLFIAPVDVVFGP
jgi:hypothetical protein